MIKGLLSILLCSYFTFSFLAQGNIIAPHIKNYTTKDYGALKSPEVWSVSQDNNGLMYFGFTNEIGIFDGENWSFLSVPNAKNISTLENVNGVIYYGAYGSFGRLVPNKKGELNIEVISSKLEVSFGNIWRIHQIDDFIAFQSYEHVFTLKGEELLFETPKDSYHLSFECDGHLYVRERQVGVVEISHGNSEVISDNPILKEYGIFEVFKTEKSKSLIVTQELGFRHSSLDLKDPLIDPTKNGGQFAINQGIIGGTRVANNLYALNSVNNGVFFIDDNGDFKGHIGFGSGLNSDEVKDIYQDFNGKLWLATGNGISKVEVIEPFEFVGDEFGLSGNIQCLFIENNIRYVGTSLGLVKEVLPNSFEFEKTQLSNQIWDIEKVGNQIAVATNSGLYFSDNGVDFSLRYEGNWNTLYYDFSNGFLLAGGEAGVIILDEFSGWNIFSSYSFSGANKKNISFDKKNDCFWVGSSSGGILKIKFDGFDFVYTIYGQKEGEGLRIGELIIPFEIDGTCVFGTPFDLLEFTNEEEAIEELKLSGNWNDSLINHPEFFPGSFFESKDYFLGSNNYQYFLDAGEITLAVIGNDLGYFEESNKSVFDISKFASVDVGRLNFLQVEEDGLYVGGVSGLARINLFQLLNTDSIVRNVNVNFREVIYNDSVQLGVYSDFKDVKIPFSKNKVNISYASNTVHNEEKSLYSWRLVGDDDNWSLWSSRDKVEFKNLLEGDYVFEVKAKDVFGNESVIKKFAFTIVAPWYRTIWAYIIYALIFIVVVYFAIVLGRRRLKAQNQKLEGIVAERTSEIMEKNSELEESYHAIAEQKQEITDSINYAQRIQQAILPVPETIENYLSEYFVLFQPKDIVSGDFYWSSNLDDKIIFVCADCTGHGVPGAFMSMIGSDKLNQAVLEARLTNPAEILSFVNKGIKKALKQNEEEENASRDGMDVTVVSIDAENMKLQMSAAHNSLYLIRDKELIEYKATKVAVAGFTPENQEYDLNEFELKKGDCLYMTTDGYPDQFGGLKGKKLKTAVFKRILVEIADMPMSKQHEFLNNYMKEWKGNHEQIDDICVVGIRI